MSWQLLAHRVTKVVSDDRRLTRLRANIRVQEWDDGYGHVYHSEQIVDFHLDGRALTSLLPGGMHAPVVDVDHPVAVRPDDRGAAITVTTDLDPRKVNAALAPLIDDGLVLAVTFPTARARHWWNRLREHVGSVQIILPVPAVALPSRSRGHFHLLVQAAMTWDDARQLLTGLGEAGLVDPRFAAISSRGDFMFVENPCTDHDTI